MPAPPPNYPPPPQPGPYGQQPPMYGVPTPQPPPPAQPGTIPLTAQTLGSVYSGGWRTITQNPGAMLGQPALWYTLAALALTAPLTVWLVRLLNYIWQVTLTESAGQLMGPTDAKAMVAWVLQDMVLWAGLGMLVYSVLVLIGTAITVAPTMRATVGLPTRAGQSWRLLKPALPRILLAGIISWAAGVAVLALVVWLSYVWMSAAMDADFAGGQAGVDAALELSLGSTWFTVVVYVLEIAFFLLVIRFVYVLPAMVVENLGLFAALKRSWNLVKGRYWQVLGTLVLGSMIISFVMGLLLSVLIVIVVFAGVLTMDLENFGTSINGLAIWSGVAIFLSVALSLIAMFLILPVAVLTYADTRIRKEGLLGELTAAGFQDPTIAAARAGDEQALAVVADYIPGTVAHDRRFL